LELLTGLIANSDYPHGCRLDAVLEMRINGTLFAFRSSPRLHLLLRECPPLSPLDEAELTPPGPRHGSVLDPVLIEELRRNLKEP
jgi:hypothetical protein